MLSGKLGDHIMSTGRQNWDVFISHASEDKESVARPIALGLEKRGVRVWFDQHALILGDSLRQKIDAGLSSSRWGAVILSPSFLAKEWTQAELDALMTREFEGERVLLPIWHDISRNELAATSPLLAARIGVDTALGIDAVCDAIVAAINSKLNEEERQPYAPRTPSFETLWFSQEWFSHEPNSVMAGLVADQAKKSDGKLIGSKVHRYVLREYLGSGGSGIVFRAFDGVFGKDVALKVLYPVRGSLAQLTRATERAVRGLGTLDDPRIVRLLDIGYLRQGQMTSAYLTSELVHGVSLSTWAAEIGISRKSWGECWNRMLEIAIQIAKALETAHNCAFIGVLGFHERGVLHGDIKPENILVDPKSDAPKILDFMLPDLQRLVACPILQEREDWTRDEYGYNYLPDSRTLIFGTPGFMPPEQAVDGVVTPASDVYTLGQTLKASFWPRKSGDPPDPYYPFYIALAGGVSGYQQRFAKVVERMTQYQPELRPQTMGEVVEDLLNLQRDAGNLSESD